MINQQSQFINFFINMKKDQYIYLPKKQGHIVILMGATFEAEGSNNFVLNNVRQWKKMGYRITVICQDRSAKDLQMVNSFMQGDFPKDTPKLKSGQFRVYVPHLTNNVMPFFGNQQFSEYKGVQAKMFHEMTDQEIQSNIQMNLPSVRAVCLHDRPIKVIAKYIILCGEIFQRTLYDLNIPYNMIVIGPALAFSLKPYPERWKKWILPSFKHVENFYPRTQFIKKQFLKIFEEYKDEYQLEKKIIVIQPSVNMSKFKIPQSLFQCQQQFLDGVRKCMLQKTSLLNYDDLKFPDNLDADSLHDHFVGDWKKNELNNMQNDLLKKWIKYSPQDETILYVGSLIKNRGIGELLIIAPKLIAIKPNLKFIFCGSGPYKEHMIHMLNAFEEGDFHKASLIAKTGEFVTQLNIQDHFMKINKSIKDRIIFTGLLQLPLLYNLIPLCTVIVCPSRAPENFCMRTIESLCFGVTPILNYHSWFIEMVDRIQKNFPELIQVTKVQKQNFFDKLPETIIKTLEFIRNNPLGKKEYKLKLRKIANDYFSWEHTASVLARRPNQIIKNSNSSKSEETSQQIDNKSITNR